MLNCDILLCSGKSLISEAIKKATNSIYSHAGIIIKLRTTDNTLIDFVVEAVNPQVVLIPLSRFLENYKNTGKRYHGELYIASFKDGLSCNQSKMIVLKALDQIETNYDNVSILKQAFNSVFGLDLNDENIHRVICSELVYNAYSSAGICLNKENEFCTPASIGRDSRFIITKI